MSDTNLFEDVGHMFGFSAEGAEWLKKQLTDQADGMIAVMVRMYATTSDVYVPRKVTDRQRIALYKCLEQHCRDKAHAIGTSDWTFGDEDIAEKEQREVERKTGSWSDMMDKELGRTS
jgi:hypothetical protein